MSSFPISSSNATLSLPASPSLFDCCKLHKLNQSRWKIRSISFDFDGMQGAVHIMLEYTVNKNGIPLIRHVTREVGQHFPAVKANLQFGELCCWKIEAICKQRHDCIDIHQTWAGYKWIPSSAQCKLCELHIIVLCILLKMLITNLPHWASYLFFFSFPSSKDFSLTLPRNIYASDPQPSNCKHVNLILIKCNSQPWPVSYGLSAVWLQLVMCLQSYRGD